MAKVHAAKTLEAMLDTVSERTGIDRSIQQQRQPGLQIVIYSPADGSKQVVCGPPPAPLIEVTPAPEGEPELAIPSGDADLE
jgi:hypothetical protein